MDSSFKLKKLQIVNLIIVILCGIIFGFLEIREIRYRNITKKYSQIKNWKNELKYFCFGLGYNTDLDTLEINYNLDVIFMGDLIYTCYLLYDFYVATEVIKDYRFKIPYRTVADSIWDYFVRAMETDDIEYMIANSLDSINCSELDIPTEKNDEIYESKFIFNNNLDKLMHQDNLLTRDHNTYETDSTIYINYQIKCSKAEEGGYNLIFFFEKKENKYLFSGMILS